MRLSGKKSPDVLHMFLPLVSMREVGGTVQCNPFHFLDAVEERLHYQILGFVIGSVDQKGRDVDVAQ